MSFITRLLPILLAVWKKLRVFKCNFQFFEAETQFNGENKKTWKKVAKFQLLFQFEVRYLQNRWLAFDDL